MIKLFRPIIFSTMLCPFAVASIDEDSNSLTDILNLADTVVTASRTSQSISKAPATIRVVTAQMIKERGYKDIKDIFRDLPGFDFSEDLTGEVRSLAVGRGILGANKFMFLLDGKKLNVASGERFILGNNMPLNMVKQIEVVYGPASAMYGADAYSGVLNIITYDYEDLEDLETKGELDVSFGTNSQLDTSIFYGEKITEDINYIAHFRRLGSDGWDLSKVDNKYSTANLGHKYDQPVFDYNFYSKFNFGDDFTLSLYRQFAHEAGGPSAFIGLGGGMVFDREFFWQQVQNKVSFEHTHEDEKFSLTSRLSFDEYEVSDGTQFKYKAFTNYVYAHTQSMKWEELLELEVNDDSKLVAGFSVEKTESFPKNNRFNSPWSGGSLSSYPMPGIGVAYPANGPAQVAGQTITYGAFNYTDYGVFAEYTKQVSEKLQVNLGVRYDYNSDFYNTLNPRLGFVYQADEQTNMKLLYGSAYIKPSKYLAYESWNGGALNGGPGQVYFVQNPSLAAEEMDSYQFNIERKVNDKLKLTLNSFKNEIKNLIRPQWAMYGANLFGFNVNSGTPETKGYEFLMDFTPKEDSFGYLYYSNVDAQSNDTLNNPITKVADRKIHAGWTWKQNKNSYSLRGRHHGKAPYNQRSTGKVAFMKARTVVDFSFRRDVNDKGALYLSVNNLFDKDYYAPSPFGEGTDWLEDTAVQPKRYIEVGYTLKF
ncbi:MAG: TonB-dependent receptor [Candidatus Cloacimonetes bacterium]|nr:TonB-dependent receptor [Candidatus Cloacimonadota bacterium]